MTLTREALRTTPIPHSLLWLGLPYGWRFSMGGPLLCRPLPPSLDVAGARFRPSPTATVCGLLPLSFAGYPRVGITLGRRRASALRRTIYSNLVRAPAGAGFRASAGFTSPRLRSLGDRCAVVHQLWVPE